MKIRPIRPKHVLTVIVAIVVTFLLCIIPKGFLLFLLIMSSLVGTVYIIIATIYDSWTPWRD